MQAFSARASPAWANQSDARKARLRRCASEPGCTRSGLGGREASDKNWFLELVSLLTIADEVRVPGGAGGPVWTLLCVFFSVFSVSLWLLFCRVLLRFFEAVRG